ncbi:MAG: SDR family oxidoreductase [Terriglobus roseus]|nr:SDR family oxidoreductase [Terriglobus roseus]
MACAVARAGCTRLCLADIDYDGLLETRRQIEQATADVRVELTKVDISAPADVDYMVRTCVDVFGRLDYALNVAGVVPQRTPIAQTDVSVYDKVVEVNEYGVSFPPSNLASHECSILKIPQPSLPLSTHTSLLTPFLHRPSSATGPKSRK